ncbi:DUF4395 domain-containing protein [Paenibacillus sp. LHD-117]|uniref:DUF4395 domain-containing protein n=1 Tax=Paenibacillus sp. LHD-117 TaxID=3071412 RepID=UPI0027E0DCDD|nr:DUF4395 domain-containing protein [Paenibacillus sp. LHD-117]MDQ6423610.1 DUF4395 domain-containing protein [Paenibacillus sp. LHD-117]
MKEVPIPYVRSNQAGIVLSLAAFFTTQSVWIIGALFLIQAIGLLFGPRGNLFIRIARPFLGKLVARGKTEAAELQRFNNSLAVLFLTLSLISLLLGWSAAGNVFAAMMGAAALAALLGYCIGCMMYFQYKQFRARRLQRR